MILKVLFNYVRLVFKSFALIICHCHAVTDRAIRACALDGACSIERVGECTGAGTKCGGCHASIAEIVGETAAQGPSEISARRLPMARERDRAA